MLRSADVYSVYRLTMLASITPPESVPPSLVFAGLPDLGPPEDVGSTSYQDRGMTTLLATGIVEQLPRKGGGMVDGMTGLEIRLANLPEHVMTWLEMHGVPELDGGLEIQAWAELGPSRKIWEFVKDDPKYQQGGMWESQHLHTVPGSSTVELGRRRAGFLSMDLVVRAAIRPGGSIRRRFITDEAPPPVDEVPCPNVPGDDGPWTSVTDEGGNVVGWLATAE